MLCVCGGQHSRRGEPQMKKERVTKEVEEVLAGENAAAQAVGNPV
jgi:hypothetical protein